MLFLLGRGAMAQDITVFSGNGRLSWTNGLAEATYEVEWTPSILPPATVSKWIDGLKASGFALPGGAPELNLPA